MFRATTITSEVEDQLLIPSLHHDTWVTLTKSQKKRIAESAAEADREDKLLWSTATWTSEQGIVLAVVPPRMEADCASAFATAGIVLTTNEGSEKIVEQISTT